MNKAFLIVSMLMISTFVKIYAATSSMSGRVIGTGTLVHSLGSMDLSV